LKVSKLESGQKMEFDSHGHYNGKLLEMPLHRVFPDTITGFPRPPPRDRCCSLPPALAE
jgi:hypothetical protein